MERGVLLPAEERIDSVALGERAERLGYHAVWSSELWGADAFVRLAQIAERTDDVALGTAIVNVFSRTPAALAQAGATLDRASDGRFTLGTGTSTPKAVRDLHSMSFDRPIRRSHETIDLVRRFSRGEGRVEYDGECFQVADFPALGADFEVWHAALGPANRRVVGRLCEGWIPHMIPFDRLETVFDDVAEAAEGADRDPAGITVAPYVPCAVSDDPGEARDAVRGHVAYYVGSGEGYRRAVGAAFPDRADRIAEAWREGDRGEAAGLVTDEMVAALGVAGTPEDAEAQLADLPGIVDHAMVVVPANAAAELTDPTVEALAPARQ
jgi:alkanesulfonate monooxygenase SsuD/methylene tetrahydromethanopterin reductase-like flavin-dependent oxidoreductase (luciferase family)